MKTSQELQAAKAAARQRALDYQAANRVQIGKWTIQPAIGQTGGAANVGWELLCTGQVDRFFGTKAQAMARQKELENV